jgi:DNA polymerase III delta prime subunit
MAYVSLYRKYRPQTFHDIVGQDHVTGTLVNAIQTGQVHHAMLFCGTRGTGKTSTARVLAKALNCVRGPTPEPCNVCDACVSITNGTNLDVTEIDAASHGSVDDARDLREKAALTGLVDRAERRGLAERAPVPGDRRALRVTLTDAGRRSAAAFHAEVTAELSRLLSPLAPEDREQFRTAMARITQSGGRTSGWGTC